MDEDPHYLTDFIFDQAEAAYDRYWAQLRHTNQVPPMPKFNQLPWSMQLAWAAIIRPLVLLQAN